MGKSVNFIRILYDLYGSHKSFNGSRSKNKKVGWQILLYRRYYALKHVLKTFKKHKCLVGIVGFTFETVFSALTYLEIHRIHQNQAIFDDFVNVLGKEQKRRMTNIVPHTVLPLETLSKNISKKEKFGGNGWFYVSIALKATVRCENREISSDPMIYTGRA